MLYQRNMYPLAIELAQNSGMSNEQQSLIYRKFGDHLYQKSDYDGAMNQYIRAIDATEPSQVIRKVRSLLYLAPTMGQADEISFWIHKEYTI
jgi:Tfp pilus assembly protein PilF